ncbi:hypothetical protein SAMN05421866_0008 [Chryseobacterium oranimense]|uniref:Uncharacterized protein n=1 Tax=Chryseobacterium oranimense TaxID=421058 RepID=A0A1M5X6P8_9FLAO|nr:hypothetical protein SAMN05421866_0008 [Chryseobacterium oranimense]
MKVLTTFIWALILIVCAGILLYLALDPNRETWDRILKGCIGFIMLWKAYDKIEKSTY